MKVYLAAPYAARDRLHDYAEELGRFGHTYTSSWLDETVEVKEGTVGTATDVSDAQAQQHVRKDIRDVRRSDALIVWTYDTARQLMSFDGGNSGGRHVETGVALALGIPVIVIGQAENIFHRASNVWVVPNWHEACMVLAEMERNLPKPADDRERVA